MSPRRVLLLCGYYYPESVGGTEKYIHLLACDLRAQGLEVVIAAPSQDGSEREYQHDGFNVYRYPIDPEPERPEVRGESAPRYLDRFSNWLDALQPDLVHMHSYTRGCGYWHAREISARRIPLVVTVHVPSVTCVRGTMLRWGSTACDGTMIDRRCTACFLQGQGVPTSLAWGVASIPSRIASPVAARPERHIARLGMRSVVADEHGRTRGLFAMADRVVAVAEWLAAVLRQNGCPPGKLSVSRHGLSADDLVLRRDNARPSDSGRLELGYVGRLDATKGIDRVIRAMRLIESSLPIGLSIYGVARDDEQRAYAAMLERLSQGDARIAFRGEVTAANRAEVFRSLDAMVVPSVWFETGPLVVLEAFGAGIPVIGSAHSGIAELVTDGVSGLLVDNGSPERWAQTLTTALQRFAVNNWQWTIPQVRSSQQVAAEMRRIYDDLWPAVSSNKSAA